MIHGIVTPEREAVVRIKVVGSKREQEVDAVIDTGFTDFLTLPPSLVAKLDLRLAAPLLATIAGGIVVEMNCYSAAVLWFGERERDILVVECDGEPLIGMSMLYGCDLHIQAIEGGQVTISARDSDAN
jgi:clan AA aspartic protease